MNNMAATIRNKATVSTVYAKKNAKDTCTVWEKISYTWKISKANDFILSAVDKTSPSFYGKWKSDFVCNIILKPQAEPDEPFRDFIAVFFRLTLESKDFVYAKCLLSVRNSEGHVIDTKEGGHKFTKISTEAGFNRAVKKSDLLSHISDDTIIIHVEIFTKLSNLEMEEPQLPSDQNLPGLEFQQSFAERLDSAEFSDCLFNARGTILNGHKYILSAKSTVLAAMLDCEIAEDESVVIEITNFDGENFKRFLGFLYTNKVEIPNMTVAMNLYHASMEYNVEDLRFLCTHYITSNLTSFKVGPLLNLAETIHAAELKDILIDYVIDNTRFFTDIDMDMYQYLEKQNPRILSEMLTLIFRNFTLEERISSAEM